MKNISRLLTSFTVARPESEWHEDIGPVLWWRFPVDEAPWVGSPLCQEWEAGYYTHWTPIITPLVRSDSVGERVVKALTE